MRGLAHTQRSGDSYKLKWSSWTVPLPNSLFAHAELRCLVDSLRMMELRANTTKGCDSYLATQWNLGALVLVVGSNKDAKRAMNQS